MAYTITVTSRVVNDDGSIQYQMDDGSGVVFADSQLELEWCDETSLDGLIKSIAIRLAVCKTVHYGHDAAVTVDIDDINGLIVRSY